METVSVGWIVWDYQWCFFPKSIPYLVVSSVVSSKSQLECKYGIISYYGIAFNIITLCSKPTLIVILQIQFHCGFVIVSKCPEKFVKIVLSINKGYLQILLCKLALPHDIKSTAIAKYFDRFIKYWTCKFVCFFGIVMH